MIDIRIAHVQPKIVFDEVCNGGSDQKLKGTINEIAGSPVVNIEPQAKLVGEACLIEITQPQLLAVVYFFFNRLRRAGASQGSINGDEA